MGETYSAVARSAAAAVGAEACHLALYDPESDELIAGRPHYAAQPATVPQFRFPADSSPASARVLRTREPYVCNDPGSDPLYHPSAGERGLRSVLTVPVQRGERLFGLLYALNKPGGFAPEDAAALTALADTAAVTLENVQLYAHERERRVLNESLREVSRVLVGSSTEEDAALGAVLDQMGRVVSYDTAAALVLGEQRLRVAASRGGEAGAEIALDEAGDLRAALEGQQLVVFASAAHLPALGLRHIPGKVLAAPLVAKGELLGAFVAAFDADHPPGRREEQLVTAFAEHAALFIEAGSVLRRERLARARGAAVARITRVAAHHVDPGALLKAVAPEILSLSGADRVVLYLRHCPRASALDPVADAGTAPDEEVRVRELRLDLQDPALGPLAEALQPVAFHAESTPPPASIAPYPDTRALLVLPLVSRDQVLGAIALACIGHSRSCEKALVEMLMEVAQQVAMGVDNARLIENLAQMAATDELTQLGNRRKLIEAFRVELARSRRAGTMVSLLLADIDHLKWINDGYGHLAGDAAIRHVADAMKRGRRETDVAARLGGEEFAVLLPGTDRVGAVKAAERIRRELAGTTIPTVGTVTVSVGVATFPEDGSLEEELYQTADERLYAAKTSGRNQVCYINLPASGPSPKSLSRRGTLTES